MTSIRLNPLDAAWLFTESRATPNHVGGLLHFKLPADAPKDFMRKLMTEFRGYRKFTAPWNRKLKYAFNMNPMAEWVEDRNIDLEYHVRHAALPWPGGERELGELVGRLQSTPIDLSRPPWECTIIEGLEGDRFALFIKMHHSFIDGVSGVKLLQGAMSDSAKASLELPPFWALGKEAKGGSKRQSPPLTPETLMPTVAHAVTGAMQEISMQAKTVPQLINAFSKMVRSAVEPGKGMMVPFDAPKSILNGRVREKRRFATQRFPMERLRAVAAAGECTLNDVVLAICGGALRRFLSERNGLPKKPLTAGIPVSVRPKDDEGTGNAISFIISTLGTDIAEPLKRLDAIRQSVKLAKEHVQSLPRQAMLQYTVMLMAPTILTLLTGIGGRTRPMFNITISNVPGPDTPLYFRGAELLATYPASIVTHGQALNITCQSYAGYMNFGYTGCHSSMPSMQRLAVYTGDALQELEDALMPKASDSVAQKRAAKAPAKPAAKKAAPSKGTAKLAPKAVPKVLAKSAAPAVAKAPLKKSAPAKVVKVSPKKVAAKSTTAKQATPARPKKPA